MLHEDALGGSKSNLKQTAEKHHVYDHAFVSKLSKLSCLKYDALNRCARPSISVSRSLMVLLVKAKSSLRLIVFLKRQGRRTQIH